MIFSTFSVSLNILQSQVNSLLNYIQKQQNHLSVVLLVTNSPLIGDAFYFPSILPPEDSNKVNHFLI